MVENHDCRRAEWRIDDITDKRVHKPIKDKNKEMTNLKFTQKLSVINDDGSKLSIQTTPGNDFADLKIDDLLMYKMSLKDVETLRGILTTIKGVMK